MQGSRRRGRLLKRPVPFGRRFALPSYETAVLDAVAVLCPRRNRASEPGISGSIRAAVLP